jgi:hypothetical protein
LIVTVWLAVFESAVPSFTFTETVEVVPNAAEKVHWKLPPLFVIVGVPVTAPLAPQLGYPAA